MRKSLGPSAAHEDAIAWFDKKVTKSRKDMILDARLPFRAPGNSQHEVLLVRSGIVGLYTLTGPRQRQILALRYPGEFVFPVRECPRTGVAALVPSKVSLGSRLSFEQALDEDRSIQAAVGSIREREQAIALYWLERLGSRNAIERIADLLCETVVRLGVLPEAPFEWPFNQYQIAEATSQTSVNVNRSMRALDDQGFIARDRKTMLILDWPALQQFARFDPTYLL